MSDKAAKKKQYILDTAKQIFAEKGFKDVTMKDIVEACDISRGGLYLYFDSTGSIFEEILKQEKKEGESILSDTSKDDTTSGDVLAMFLNEQKKDILSADNSLSVAIYEYMFSKYSAGEPCRSMCSAFEEKADAIASLIKAGVESEEFYSEDPEESARNILYVIEGMKIASQTIGITEKEIDRELLYIMGGLIV